MRNLVIRIDRKSFVFFIAYRSYFRYYSVLEKFAVSTAMIDIQKRNNRRGAMIVRQDLCMIESFLLSQPIITLVVLLNKRDDALLQGTRLSFLKKKNHSRANAEISVFGLKVRNRNLSRFFYGVERNKPFEEAIANISPDFIFMIYR